MADLNDKVNQLTETKDTTADYEKEDIDKNKGMGVLAYLSILVLIPLFAAKDSKFARFHTNQGLVLFICEVAVWIITAILGGIPILGVIISIVGWLLNIAFLVLAIIGIVNVVNGKAKELPVIGKYTIIK